LGLAICSDSALRRGEENMMARAIWNGVVLAETSRPVLLDGNVYFPPQDVRGGGGPGRAG
jgi:uncharacterized protein (DUF427 family)